MTPVCLADAFARVAAHWRPQVVATLNGQEVKVVRVLGTFVWHRHPDVDELFWVIRGTLRIEMRGIEMRGIEMRDRTVTLGPGELFVVPRGVEHRPVADAEVEMVLFEPAGVVNTGDAPESELTAPAGRLAGDAA